jgi:DNA-binding transcriptional LysR family regulator
MLTRWPVVAGHLEKIPYFVTIARLGTIRAAAHELRLAQPSLSRSMQVLEVALGVKLFERGRRGVTLTAGGKEFLGFCETLLASLAAVERKVLAAADDSLAGQMRIGTHETFVREFWPGLVRWQRRATPRMKLTLFTSPSIGELVRKLTAGELDLVVAVECGRPAGIDLLEIRADHYALFASAAFCKRHGIDPDTPLTATSLERFPLIYANTVAGPGVLLRSALQAAGLERPSDHTVRSLESVASLLDEDLGIGLLPRRIVLADKRSRLVELSTSALGARIGIHRLFIATPQATAGEGVLADIIAQLLALLR